MPKYAEELVEILYIKPHTIIANKEYGLTLGTSAPYPNHRWVVSPQSGGVKIGKLAASHATGARRRTRVRRRRCSRSRQTKIGLLARSLVALRV